MTQPLTRSRATSGPSRTERPTTVTDAAEVLRNTSGSVLFRGGATKLDWAGRVDPPDLLLDTTALQGVLTHNPADLTASVRAGTPLTALQENLAEAGQWLALDPPTASRGATVGGLLAAGDSGPARLKYGGLRDLVIGITLVLADGTVARSGGHVIKNVAGYDLAKLAHGSLGSLALITEVVVRLHPRPAGTVTLSGQADAARATAATLALAAGPLEPAAIEWLSDGTTGRLLVRTDGTLAALAAAERDLRTLLAQHGISAEPLSPSDADAAWQAHATAVLGEPDETVLRIAGLPSELASTARHALETAQRTGLTVQLVCSAALGMHTVRLAGASAPAHAEALTTLRSGALARGASVLLRQRPAALDPLIDALGPPPDTTALLRRIKAQFDPAHRLGPGRFAPWF